VLAQLETHIGHHPPLLGALGDVSQAPTPRLPVLGWVGGGSPSDADGEPGAEGRKRPLFSSF